MAMRTIAHNFSGTGLSALSQRVRAGLIGSCRKARKRRLIGGCPAMLKADAERDCIRRWRDLPKGLRSTQAQAASFARILTDVIEFDTSGDHYTFINGWLQRDLLLRGGL